jgi:predicted ATP-grasp superfamily ATP-dependent carboligase
MSERLIIVGASCRAAAESAVRSGFSAWCIDQFGDEDLRACAEHVEVVSRWPDGILDVIPKIPPGTFVITGALENAPQVLARLRDRLPFAGCDVDAMRALRDPLNLQQILQQAGLSALTVALREPSSSSEIRWLKKPLRSAAGFHICRFNSEGQEPAGSSSGSKPRFYFQEFSLGRSLSGLYLSDGERCQLLGLTEQLIGSEAGADAFRYGGSIGPLTNREVSPEVFVTAESIGQALVEASGCRGLFGADLLWDEQAERLSVCEVNPRYTASAEVIERATEAPLMRWHIAACRGERTVAETCKPSGASTTSVVEPADFHWALGGADSQGTLHGKLICFAQEEFPATALNRLRGEVQMADIPHADQVIPAGHPICTVIARGETADLTREALLEAVSRIYDAAQ